MNRKLDFIKFFRCTPTDVLPRMLEFYCEIGMEAYGTVRGQMCYLPKKRTEATMNMKWLWR